MQTIHDAATAIRAGNITPLQLVEQCLTRIDQLDDQVHAWVFVDRDGARAEAKRLHDEFQRGYYRGPLHGIPIGVKDIFDVFDWPTAAGSKHWANAIARRDAVVVDRLRQAGAILLGKTVTTAYASFDPPITRNPWNVERTPGGSSSGSAAAIACGMCFGALASQTGGSITRPASFCGVAGIKPSFGRISVDGVVPLAASMDHVGVMANTVADLAILLEAIDGPSPCPALPDLLRAIGEGPEFPDLARLRGFFDERADPVMRNAMDALCEKLREGDMVVRDLSTPSEFHEVIPRHRTIMAVEAAAFHESRFRRRPDDYPPRITELLQEGLKTSAPEYARCRDHQRQLSETMQNYFDDVSALITPATLGAAPNATTTGDPACNSPWSYTGHPTVSLPMAWTDDGMPLCVQIIGPMYEEAELLALAAHIERIIAFPRREVS